MKPGLFAKLFTRQLDLDAPAVDLDAPAMDLDAPAMDLDAPAVDLGAPAVDLDAPVVDLDAPVVDLGAPVVDLGAPVVDLGAPAMDLDAPVVDLDAPAVDLDAPTMDLGAQAVGSNHVARCLHEPGQNAQPSKLELPSFHWAHLRSFALHTLSLPFLRRLRLKICGLAFRIAPGILLDMRFPLVAVISAGLSLSLPAAESFRGAEAILKELAAQSGSPKALNPVEALKQSIEAFDEGSEALAPQEAATQWLALFDRFAALPEDAFESSRGRGEPISGQTLLGVLPAASAWDALTAATAARPAGDPSTAGLRLVSAVLTGDNAARQSAIAALRKGVKDQRGLQSYERERMGEALKELEALFDESSQGVAGFLKKLAAWEMPATDRSFTQGMPLSIPDLVRLAGEEAATPLIERALRLGGQVNVAGAATRRLTAKIALRNIDLIKTPSWQLITQFEDMALYEAFAKLPQSGGGNWTRREADAVYLMGLIVKNPLADAVKFARANADRFQENMGTRFGSQFENLRREGAGRQVLAFLREMISLDADSSFWGDFLVLSAQENQSAAALAFLRDTLRKPDLSAAARATVQSHYFAALLAADEVEEGTRVLRELVAANQAPGAGKDSDGFAVKLVSLGRLLERPELVQEGLAAVHADLKRGVQEEREESVVGLLLDLGRGPEAEQLAAGELLKLADRPGAERMRREASLLVNLAWIYHRTGRHADVLRLLESAPLWGAPDLGSIAGLIGEPGAPSLGLMAARALAAAGRVEESRRILERVLQRSPGNDSAYALLLELGGADLEADLQRRADQDRFQERPLIWKAKLQLDAGRLEDAEKTVRAAIAIDPSDGEQGKGDRMRAYAVLGDILEKRGDLAQATTMRGAVAAIRISERADDWWSAGLLSRAVKMYEDALGRFADAYCIQSRLALRYSEQGEFAKAEQAYRRAFELMPGSFGRVESHCFGCEGAFTGQRAQSIAEKVFESLAIELPDRPQVFYLLGYLREAQQRPADAAELFRKAVALDPDYLNAWGKLQGLSHQLTLPAAEREAAALAILRLDPKGNHARPDFENITDLKKLWTTLRAAIRALPPQETDGLYPLPAAAAMLRQKEPLQGSEFMRDLSDPPRRAALRFQFSEMPVMRVLGAVLEFTARQR